MKSLRYDDELPLENNLNVMVKRCPFSLLYLYPSISMAVSFEKCFGDGAITWQSLQHLKTYAFSSPSQQSCKQLNGTFSGNLYYYQWGSALAHILQREYTRGNPKTTPALSRPHVEVWLSGAQRCLGSLDAIL